MSDPQIRYAIDPATRNIVDAQAGKLPRKPYECIKCGGRLKRRQGPKQVWHFAHYGGKNAKECPLYYGGHYEDLLNDLRTSEIETAEREKSIRVIVIPSPYGRSLRVYGLLPTIDREQLPSDTRVSRLISSMELTSVGLKYVLSSDRFHPRNAEVLFELDPAAEKYSIQVDINPEYPALAGHWECRSLQEGDVFAGEPERAERVAKVGSLNEGERIYVFLSSEPVSLLDSARTYRAGPWHVVSFDLDSSTAFLLEELTGKEWNNPPPFYVDVVLPPYTDPRSRSPIIGETGASVVLSVIPPSDMDPEFEVVSIPLRRGHISKLDQVGKGSPRWYRTEIPDNGSRRLSINWADRHRAVHLHAQSYESPSSNLQAGLEAENPVGLRNGKIDPSIVVASWSSIPIRVKARDDTRCLSDLGITALTPPGFRFDVLARFEESSDVGPTIRRRGIGFKDLDKEFGAWIREGLKETVIDFGVLGSLQILLDPTKPWKKSLTDKEIKKRIHEMEEVPDKARWSLVRKVCGAPPGTPHIEFPGGIKKRVRRALMEILNEQRK